MPTPHLLLIVPSNNTTMEREMGVLFGSPARLDVARVARPLRMLAVEDLLAYAETTLESVARFLQPRPDLVVYGCTAAGFLSGPEGNRRIVDALADKTGACVISTAQSMVEALRSSGARATTLVTPYLEAVNPGLVSYLEQSGIRVEALSTFACTTTDELAGITQAQVLARALETATPGSASLFIACSQLPMLEVVPQLRERLGIPVWSSIAATAWLARHELGRSQPVPAP